MLVKKPLASKSNFYTCCFVTILFAIALYCYLVFFDLPSVDITAKKILIWEAKGEVFDLKLFESEKECDYVCSYTTKQDKRWQVSKYDAVIFGQNALKYSYLPEKFDSKQKYIFLSSEPPENIQISEKFDDAFDLVASYRFDSDIIIPIFYLIDADKNIVYPSKNIEWKSFVYSNTHMNLYDAKYKFAVFVSNNNTILDSFVEKIREYIDVDVYKEKEFNSIIGNEYYFYFALEDKSCLEYLPKSVGEAFARNTIPIVNLDSNRFLPPGSYVNVEGYNVEDLVKRMAHIVKFREEYLKYFWWRSHYKVAKYAEGERTPLCRLCKMLHDGFVNKRKFIKWWTGSDSDPICKNLEYVVSDFETN